MRSTGSLLVRALAVGGLTAAAWLFGGAVASASPVDHVPDASSISEYVHAVIAEHHESAEDTQAEVAGIREQWTATLTTAPVELQSLSPVRVPVEHAPGVARPEQEHGAEHEQAAEPEEDEEFSGGVSLVYSGGVISNHTERSGTVSNSMPEELYTAKVTAKAAAKLAAATPPPVPVEVVAPVAAEVVAAAVVDEAPRWDVPEIHVSAPVAEVEDVPAASGLEWETPRPAAPTPTPQPAQAPTAPTASSSAHDNSGGARGGLAVTTAQTALHRPSLWTAARRDDGRTPGSVQGLPSSSPD